jgi:uncharacterized membrane protein YfcA
MLILSFIGTIFGAFASQYIDVTILKLVFGFVCILSTLVLVIIKSPENLDNIKTNAILFNSVALLAGLISGLIGPAGAALIIPIFIAYFKYPITNTIGTNSAMSVAISLAGVIIYIILGLGVQGLPDYSLGYVNLLQFVFLSITSIIVSGYAANMANRISTNKLKILQVVVITYIGLQMMGVFDFIF